MSAEPQYRIFLTASARFRVLFLTLSLPLSLLHGITWEEAVNAVPYPRITFADTTLKDALTRISDQVTEEIEPATLPNLAIQVEKGVDLETRVSADIPDTFAGPAIAYLLRQADYQGTFSENTLIVRHTRDRRASLESLGRNLISRELLFLSLQQDPSGWDSAVTEVAADVIQRTTVFRLGPNAMGVVPTELAALHILMRQPDPLPLLKQLKAEAQLAGKLYALAALHHLGEEVSPPETPIPVPTQTLGGNLIILVKPEILWEEDILTGSFIEEVLGLAGTST